MTREELINQLTIDCDSLQALCVTQGKNKAVANILFCIQNRISEAVRYLREDAVQETTDNN